MSAAKLIFAGTPDFALASLQALVEAGYDVVAVMTQPDRPSGRGRKLTPSPVKKYAQASDIPVLQPVTLKDPAAIAAIEAFEPDLLVVAAYGLLLPAAALEVPRLGCLNVHASLLPRWRGAAPIQRAILSGDTESGVCLMQMEAGLDTGPVFAAETHEIGADETAGELHDALAALGGRLLTQHLEAILDGTLAATPQDESQATYAAKFSRTDARLDWRESAEQLARVVRAFNPVPGAWFDMDGEAVKLWRAEVEPGVAGPAGVVVESRAEPLVACGDGALRLIELQRPGRRRIDGRAFADQLNLDGKRLT